MVNNPNSILYIAEVSANHLGSLERAKNIVKAAASAGATAVKFQTYTADTMTLDIDNFRISENHPLWGGRRLYDLYQEAHTPWEWHQELFDLARSLNLIPFSTPFDLSAIEFLESLDAPMYKIASMETGDLQLIEAAAKTGKPLIISTGATELQEIQDVVELVQSTGNQGLTLLVCTSSYPADPKDSHVRRIKTLSDLFGCNVGLSDHTLGIGASLAAISLGAVAIEKHLTLRRSDGGADGEFSMEPQEFKQLVDEGNAALLSLGESKWAVQGSEKESRNLRRTLYVVEDVKTGDLITNLNVRSIRPGQGLEGKYLGRILGGKFNQDLKKGTPMSLDYVN